MRSLSSLVLLTLVAAFSMGGCAWLKGGPISLPVYKLQQPAVKAATESSASARDNWKDYKADDQKAFLEANAKAWDNLNRVYNSPEEGTTSP